MKKNKEAQLVKFDEQALQLAEKKSKAAVLAAKDFKIDTSDEAILAKEALLHAKNELNQWEEKKSSILKPLNEAIKNTKKLFAPVLDAWEEVEGLLKFQLGSWEQKREALRAAEHAKLLEAAKDRYVVEDVKKLAMRNAEEELEQVKGISFSDRWYAEVVDFQTLPDQFKIPNQSKLDAMARAMKSTSNIPGVVFKCEKTVRAAV